MALAAALASCIVHFWWMRLRGPLTLERRAHWLQAACRRVMSRMEIRCLVEGRPPGRGLLVSNHLSYLDIVIYGAIAPCFFVSKAEVGSWPYFGRAARTGGAMFLERGSRTSTNLVAEQMAERLRLPIPVLLFPEGTSTDGAQVLRFHSGLFEPAVAQSAPITAAAISYELADGTAERELCWYGDTLFLPHLWKTLTRRGFSAHVRFAETRVFADRRTAATAAHDAVAVLRGLGTDSICAPSIPSLTPMV